MGGGGGGGGKQKAKEGKGRQNYNGEEDNIKLTYLHYSQIILIL